MPHATLSAPTVRVRVPQRTPSYPNLSMASNVFSNADTRWCTPTHAKCPNDFNFNTEHYQALISIIKHVKHGFPHTKTKTTHGTHGPFNFAIAISHPKRICAPVFVKIPDRTRSGVRSEVVCHVHGKPRTWMWQFQTSIQTSFIQIPALTECRFLHPCNFRR